MQITATLVKELRERTNAPMMDCKKALTESNGVIEIAIENMRKAGQAKAVKKAGRIAAEGTIGVLSSQDNSHSVLVEINCETDFVAREEKFKKFVVESTKRALEGKAKDAAELLALPMNVGQTQTVDEARLELVAQIGENVSIRRVCFAESNTGVVGSYGHGDANGVRIGALVSLKAKDDQLARDLCMHIAAMNPEYLDLSLIPAERITKEREILMTQTREKEADKSDEIVQKINEGKVKKFINEVALMGQAYIRDQSLTVAQLVHNAKNEIIEFKRFEVGEGIEKKEENFVEEVMNQVRGV